MQLPAQPTESLHQETQISLTQITHSSTVFTRKQSFWQTLPSKQQASNDTLHVYSATFTQTSPAHSTTALTSRTAHPLVPKLAFAAPPFDHASQILPYQTPVAARDDRSCPPNAEATNHTALRHPEKHTLRMERLRQSPAFHKRISPNTAHSSIPLHSGGNASCTYNIRAPGVAHTRYPECFQHAPEGLLTCCATPCAYLV